MDREFTLGQMAESTKESGRRVKGMDRGLTLGQMAESGPAQKKETMS